ncbi:MAG TPA: type II toxin-antitoxin system mRNA interferase toxin, RelE/StbE family [Anaerolineae bacterium]|nr:type II toxin-antitoxin system mRNA interferase toxin, RelE/StbE family [Anaerolineae bacterium]
MRTLVWGSSFKRAVRHSLKRQPDLRNKIEGALSRLATDPFDPILRTHKLKGELSGSWACTVEYDCRIVFDFETNPATGDEEILLIDIGKHDEVY